MRLNELHLVEHTGTHLDAPSHFDVAGKTVGDIPIEDLITPLVVIDIRPRVEVDRNAALIPEDVERWERKRGRLPEGCCIALNAGWDPLASGMVPSQANRAHPGFGAEVATMLIERRSVKGIAVESMSLETGSNTTANPVHSLWLRSGRWGIEGITNLGAVPSDGALLVAGVAPIEGATGFPIRAIAVF
jgi:kynurenine formamidase